MGDVELGSAADRQAHRPEIVRGRLQPAQSSGTRCEVSGKAGAASGFSSQAAPSDSDVWQLHDDGGAQSGAFLLAAKAPVAPWHVVCGLGAQNSTALICRPLPACLASCFVSDSISRPACRRPVLSAPAAGKAWDQHAGLSGALRDAGDRLAAAQAQVRVLACTCTGPDFFPSQRNSFTSFIPSRQLQRNVGTFVTSNTKMPCARQSRAHAPIPCRAWGSWRSCRRCWLARKDGLP